MYLLCMNGKNWGDWCALSASSDPGPLHAEAEIRNVAEYNRQHAEWIARGKTGGIPLPIDDVRRDGYRTFFVKEVSDWPAVSDAE